MFGEQKKGTAAKLEVFAAIIPTGKRWMQVWKIPMKEQHVKDEKIVFANEKTGMVKKLKMIVETAAEKKNEEQFAKESKIMIVGEKTGANEKLESGPKEKFEEESETMSMGMKMAVAKGLESYLVSVRLEEKQMKSQRKPTGFEETIAEESVEKITHKKGHD